MRSRVMLSMDDAALRRWRGVEDWCACGVVRGEATRGAVRNMCAMGVMQTGRAGARARASSAWACGEGDGKISTDKKAKCPNAPRAFVGTRFAGRGFASSCVRARAGWV